MAEHQKNGIAEQQKAGKEGRDYSIQTPFSHLFRVMILMYCRSVVLCDYCYLVSLLLAFLLSLHLATFFPLLAYAIIFL